MSPPSLDVQFASRAAAPTKVTVKTKNSLRLSNFGSVDFGFIVNLRVGGEAGTIRQVPGSEKGEARRANTWTFLG
jgi:hypothetical protein